MVATDEEELADLFEAAIIAMTPRKQYKGAEGWKPYKRAVDGASRTRRFRLLLDRVRRRRDGSRAGNIFEHECRLRVRTDYAGDHAKMQFVIADDLQHLRDTLSTLKATDNGLQLVASVDSVTADGGNEDTDVLVIDHVMTVRYMRSITP